MKKIIKFIMLLIIILLLESCNTSKISAKFYSLEEAYEIKLISKDDLINIAFYYNGEKQINDDSISISKKYELTDEESLKIKRAHANRLEDRFNDIVESIDINFIYIKAFYGKYNNCYAVHITDRYSSIDIYIEELHLIDGVVFENFVIPSIEILVFES